MYNSVAEVCVFLSQALHGNSLSLLQISLIKGKSIQQTLKRLLSEALLISNVRLLKHDTQDFLGGGGKEKQYPWTWQSLRWILAKWLGRVFQKKVNDMQHDAPHITPRCLELWRIPLVPKKWAYSYCRLGESGGSQSKWPVDERTSRHPCSPGPPFLHSTDRNNFFITRQICFEWKGDSPCFLNGGRVHFFWHYGSGSRLHVKSSV